MGNGVVIEAAMVGSIVGSVTGGVLAMQFEAETAVEAEIYGDLRETGMVVGFFCGAASGAVVASEGMCADPEEEN